MCGIAGAIEANTAGKARGREALDLQSRIDALLDTMVWRGPDGRGHLRMGGADIGHLRLAIIDPEGGHQPIANEDESLWIAFNGEGHNHKEIMAGLRGHRFRTRSDAEAVLHLFEDEGPAALRRLLGMYAIAIWDRSGRLFLARDPVGIKPLYWARDPEGRIFFASEIKALMKVSDQVQEFPPGHYYMTGEGLRPWYGWHEASGQIRQPDQAIALIRQRLIEAVDRCLVSDVPVGVFLSGGLDSSLVAALARRRVGPQLKSFAVGMVGAPDLAMARKVAAYLGTDHYEYAYTPEEVQEVLPKVIYHLESFDVPLVRSAVATYFTARLASQHVKVVMTGEGADELFAGYHYLKEFKDPDDLGAELRRITRKLHNSNLQRADRETMAHSVEARVPFLELPVVEAAAAVHPGILFGPEGKTEKWLLRKVAEEFLPHEVVWRRKEKFSLGTGTGQFLEQLAASAVSDAELERDGLLPWGERVSSKEELLYWRYFREHYGIRSVVEGMGRSRTVGDYDKNPAAWRETPVQKAR